MDGMFQVAITDVSHEFKEYDIDVVENSINSAVSYDVSDVTVIPHLDMMGSDIYITLENRDMFLEELMDAARDGVRGLGECVDGICDVDEIGVDNVSVAVVWG